MHALTHMNKQATTYTYIHKKEKFFKKKKAINLTLRLQQLGTERCEIFKTGKGKNPFSVIPLVFQK